MVDRTSTSYIQVTLLQYHAYLPLQLLASPTFHRGVEKLHKSIRRIRRGPDMEDMGGTNIESQHLYSKRYAQSKSNTEPGEGKKFLDHYMEELKQQFNRGPGPKT